MSHTAIILAGGFGTRLQQVVSDVPKPMAPVAGRPFMDYQLKRLSMAGFKHVIFSTGHLAHKIETHYKTGFDTLQVAFSHEQFALGTGGGIRLALQYCKENRCIVLNGDSLFDFPLDDFQAKTQASHAKHAIALRNVPDTSRYGEVVTSTDHSITFFGEKSTEIRPGTINAGVYSLDVAHFLAATPSDTNFSIEKDFFEKQAGSGLLYGFAYEGYFIDIGIPDDYLRAQDDFKRFEHNF